MWRLIRVSVLLLVLGFVATQTWWTQYRVTRWTESVRVGVFPINADGSSAAAAHIQLLQIADFEPVAVFLAREGARYGIQAEAPVSLRLYAPLAKPPPSLSGGAGLLTRIGWSLALRYYRWRALEGIERAPPQIALFVLFHDPARMQVLPHSIGLARGLTVIAHVFAARTQTAQNNVVIAHELLHTFGATDKYDPRNNAPRYPQGFGDPARRPLYPQVLAEIMAGRIAVSPQLQAMPASLDAAVVGNETAREIGWRRR